MNVGDAAAGGFVDAAAVVFDPGKMAQMFFALDGNDGDLAGILAVWIRADFEHDLLAGGFFEEAVDVVGGVQIAAVDGKDVVSGFDVDAGLRERGFVAGIPVLAVIDFGDCDSGRFREL